MDTETRPGVVPSPDPGAEKDDFDFAMRLAGGWARKFPVGSYIRDEILSAAHLGFALAKRDHDGTGPFRHYLSSKVKGEILHALDRDLRAPAGMREWGKTSWRGATQRGVAIFQQLDPHDDGYLATRVPSHEDEVVELLSFKQSIAHLPERWARVLEAKLLDDKDQSEIARELGISGPRVHQILGKALKALRESYKEEAVCCVTQ